MVSVVTVTPEQIQLYQDLKIDEKYRFIILGLTKDRNALEIVALGEREKSLKDLEAHLPNNDCRYVVFDFEFETFENPPRPTRKILLISWAPDIAPIKVKVPFASSKTEIRSAFQGIQKDIQASDLGILDFEELRKECAH